MNLTKHFTLDELTFSEVAQRNGWDNSPNNVELANLIRLAEFLETVREVLGGKPIMITSGLRTKKINDAVGSKDTSQHRLGCAADFKVPGMTPDEIVTKIVSSSLAYDQVICEFDNWVHISVPNYEGDVPRRQALVIDKSGTRHFNIK